MKIFLKKLACAAIFSAACVGGAHAEVTDRAIPANAAPDVLFQQIVVTATAMCNEAAGKGEVFDINRCIDVVVARTVEEFNRPTLTAYALVARPSIATV
jgi:hypothetical protein